MISVIMLTLVVAPAGTATSPTSRAAKTAPAGDDELIRTYDETAEAAQKRFADEITVAKKQRDAAIAKAEKSFRAESEKATQKYLSTAEKTASKYADSLRTAIAATIAAYAGKLNESGPPAFTTAADDAHWSACDDVAEVKKFIAERAHLADHAAKPPEVPWSDGIGRFNQVVPDSGAQPIWGQQRNTWIKFVAE